MVASRFFVAILRREVITRKSLSPRGLVVWTMLMLLPLLLLLMLLLSHGYANVCTCVDMVRWVCMHKVLSAPVDFRRPLKNVGHKW